MIQIYGHRFTSAWGSEDMGVWTKILTMFSSFVVKSAIDFLITGKHTYTDFPPNPIQFRTICEMIKQETTPRAGSKLTAPCEACGKPARMINVGDSKMVREKIFCYRHYVEHQGIKIKSVLEYEKDLSQQSKNPSITEYEKFRLESIKDAAKEILYKFENC